MGHFNAKSDLEHSEFPEQTGKYGKNQLQCSVRTFSETCRQYELVIDNTLFIHKLSYRETQPASQRRYTTYDGSCRRNPVRNQINYILGKNYNLKIKKEPKIDISKLLGKEKQLKYKNNQNLIIRAMNLIPQ